MPYHCSDCQLSPYAIDEENVISQVSEARLRMRATLARYIDSSAAACTGRHKYHMAWRDGARFDTVIIEFRAWLENARQQKVRSRC